MNSVKRQLKGNAAHLGASKPVWDLVYEQVYKQIGFRVMKNQVLKKLDEIG